MLPKQARYQVTLRPVIFNCGGRVRKKTYVVIIRLWLLHQMLSLGFEPRWHYAEDFKSPVYSVSTTRANCPSRIRTYNILINSQLFCLWTMGHSQHPSVYFQNCMGFGEYLNQIIRSHLTVAESTELTIKVSCFLIDSGGSLLCAPRTAPPIDSYINTFIYETISILFSAN